MRKEIPLLEGIERHLKGESGIKILVPRPIEDLYSIEDLAEILKGEVKCTAEAEEEQLDTCIDVESVSEIPEKSENAEKEVIEKEKKLTEENPVGGETRNKRHKIDRGKVTALHDAGWTNKAIADEMGCSAWSISMILKEQYDDKS